MSSSSTPLSPEPSDRKVLYSAIAWVGVLLLFAIIVLIAYVPNSDSKVNTSANEARVAIRADVDALQQKLMTQYAWANQAEGIVRIPVARAMELTLLDLENKALEGGSSH